MTEIITVEVAGKFGPKVNGQWLGIRRPLKASDFVSGSSYEVELEPWSKNGKSGTNIVSMKNVDKQSVAQSPMKQAEMPTASNTSASTTKVSYSGEDYNVKKDRRILVQGITQAVAASPSLAGLPFTNTTEVVANIKVVAKELIEFVLEQTK